MEGGLGGSEASGLCERGNTCDIYPPEGKLISSSSALVNQIQLYEEQWNALYDQGIDPSTNPLPHFHNGAMLVEILGQYPVIAFASSSRPSND